MQIFNLSEYSEAEQAAIAQIQELSAMVDAALGCTVPSMIVVADSAALDEWITGIEADNAKQIADLLAAIEDPISFQTDEDSSALAATMESLFAEHDPLLAFAEPEND